MLVLSHSIAPKRFGSSRFMMTHSIAIIVPWLCVIWMDLQLNHFKHYTFGYTWQHLVTCTKCIHIEMEYTMQPDDTILPLLCFIAFCMSFLYFNSCNQNAYINNVVLRALGHILWLCMHLQCTHVAIIYWSVNVLLL